jgi:hypothetical protein
VVRISLKNEHGSLKSDQNFLWAVFNGERGKWFCFFRCSGLTFESPDRGVAVGNGLAIALQSLPLAGVATGKFNRGADQSSGPGGFLLLGFSCLEFLT